MGKKFYDIVKCYKFLFSGIFYSLGESNLENGKFKEVFFVELDKRVERFLFV